MCLTPVTIKLDYRELGNDDGPLENGSLAAERPCGKCYQCLRARCNAWSFRLNQEMKDSTTSAFITLTYEQEPLTPNGNATLQKSDPQKFIKRLRKRNSTVPYIKKNGESGRKSPIKYYLVGEYGGRYLRPHYHLIIFNVDSYILSDHQLLQEEIWHHGHIHVLPCNMPTINYTVSYIMKSIWSPEEMVDITTGEITCIDDREPEFATQSKNLGITYLTESVWNYHVENLVGHVRLPNNAIIPLPRYYRDKIFTRDEKRELDQYTQAIRKIDWQQFVNHDFGAEVEQKKYLLRREQKRQFLKTQKL